MAGLWKCRFSGLACVLLLLLLPTFLPDFFQPSIARTSMKLGKLVPYGCGFMTFRFFSPFSQKKIGPPYKLMIFSRFPPKKFFPITCIPMKLGILAPYGQLFMTFVFFPPFSQKKSAPPYKLAIFSRFPPKLIIIYHSYPNETWYTYSLLTSLYDVLILGPIFEKINSVPLMDM